MIQEKNRTLTILTVNLPFLDPEIAVGVSLLGRIHLAVLPLHWAVGFRTWVLTGVPLVARRRGLMVQVGPVRLVLGRVAQ